MSEAKSSDETRVTVGRWLNSYVVDAGALLRGSAVRDAMDRIDLRVAEELPASCGLRLQQALRDASGEVWRIRRLDLSFTVDVAAPRGCDIAPAWSERVTTRILDVVEHGTEMEGVLRFPDRAAYLAQFVLDLAAGRAWGKWYYEEFQSLDKLPAGRAIAETLTREPAHGMQTVLHLARAGSLEGLLAALTDGDARAIYVQCFEGFSDGRDIRDSSPLTEADLDAAYGLLGGAGFSGTSGDLSRWSGRLLEVWNGEPLRGAGAPQKDHHDALRWITRAALRYPGAEREPATFMALNGLLALRRVLAAFRSSISADRLVRDLSEEKITIEEANALAWKEGAELPEGALRFLARVARGDPDWAAQAAASLLKDKRGAVYEDESMITRFGGIFLVAPTLVELLLKEVAETAAGEGEQNQDAAAGLRHLVLAKCLGRPRALEALSDPALRLLSGCHRSSLQDGFQFAPDRLARAQVVFAENLAALSGCEGRCLVAEAIRAPGQESEVLLMRDLARNVWIYASALPHELASREQALLSGIDFVRETTGNLPHLVLQGSLARLAQSRALQARALSLVALEGDYIGGEFVQNLSRIGCVPESTPHEKIARLLASSDAEFSYFSFGDIWPGFDINLDLMSALVSRAALKGFARRLMGFQSASPEHLYRNFLEGTGTVRNGPERIEVELPRSPLSLVLQLSGLAKQIYTVPWLEGRGLEGREVCLLPPRE